MPLWVAGRIPLRIQMGAATSLPGHSDTLNSVTDPNDPERPDWTSHKEGLETTEGRG